MTTATLLPPKQHRRAGWLAHLPNRAVVNSPALPSATTAHPTQALVRWA